MADVQEKMEPTIEGAQVITVLSGVRFVDRLLEGEGVLIFEQIKIELPVGSKVIRCPDIRALDTRRRRPPHQS